MRGVFPAFKGPVCLDLPALSNPDSVREPHACEALLKGLEGAFRVDQQEATPVENAKALRAALDENKKHIKSFLDAELYKTDAVLRGKIKRADEEAQRPQFGFDNQLKLLAKQAETQAAKREQAERDARADLTNQIVQTSKAQIEAARSSALLEIRFLKLEAMVNLAMTLAKSR